jgi:hypothetical protein
MGLADSDDDDEVEKGLYELDEHGGYTKVQQLGDLNNSPRPEPSVSCRLDCISTVPS